MKMRMDEQFYLFIPISRSIHKTINLEHVAPALALSK